MAHHAHGSESFYVLGEGLLTTSGEGRPAGRRRDVAALSDADAPFRFSRMGPRGRPLGMPVLGKLAAAMIAPGGVMGDARGIPAGYTYLGQFIDHDLTFDKTDDVSLGDMVSPAELTLARSPVLDLDSVYGNGPADPESQKFYAPDLMHLAVGGTLAAPPDAAREGFDLPRGKSGGVAVRRQAVIPDSRNDENLAVAQTHLAMIRFHNRVLDKLPASVPESVRFARARRQVVKHYQWTVRHDYLPRIAAKKVVDDVFVNGRKVFEVAAPGTQMPTMPIEFSVAAFRFGHSMIRATYDWNRRFAVNGGSLDLLFFFSATGGDLGGGAKLPSNWIADFRRLYDFTDADRTDLTGPNGVNRAMRIDTRLTNPLDVLPEGTFGGFDDGAPPQQFNLAFRNLVRGRMLKLASGQQMVALMQDRGVDVTPLTRDQILQGDRGADLGDLTPAERDAVAERTPLWFYVLREAELNKGRLAGVGARIVAETFHRALEGSATSILRDPDFTPTLGRTAGRFTMADLLLFAFEGKKTLLNPLGGA
ncbi:heme peroxidase [Nocardioides sp. HDW12B]|uniref:peroxidase family protein n=1 Tax=Nocardioides sp. HDW12B TaxID=2714939 RepID=UPI00140A6F07|nr:heme peroxidase family protein [Nocardioides sp. HDW12B]QIK68096.1 heme peroxidase [Nocardioides sp. HDW12B]